MSVSESNLTCLCIVIPISHYFVGCGSLKLAAKAYDQKTRLYCLLKPYTKVFLIGTTPTQYNCSSLPLYFDISSKYQACLVRNTKSHGEVFRQSSARGSGTYPCINQQAFQWLSQIGTVMRYQTEPWSRETSYSRPYCEHRERRTRSLPSLYTATCSTWTAHAMRYSASWRDCLDTTA